MPKYLDKCEFVPFAPAHVGTVNKHHCKHGKDNDKLFITRCDDGYTILAYCHHCDYRGKFDERDTLTVEQIQSFTPVPKDNDKYVMPTNTQMIGTAGTVMAEDWIIKAGVSVEEAWNHGIVWSPWLKRVVIPVYTFGQLSVMQTRRIMFDDKGPKYCNYKNFEGLPFRSFTRDVTKINLILKQVKKVPLRKRVVLVEDALSCIRVGRHLPCVALMGTHLSDVVLAYLIKRGFTEFNVFLDDDNPEVKMKQQDLYRRLRLFGDVHVIHSGGVDPKEMKEHGLRKCLTF